MNNKKQASIKTIISLLLITCIASIAFAFKYFNTTETIKTSSLSAQKKIDVLQFQLDSMLKKSRADEFFITGDYDSAMLAYKSIPNLEHNSKLISEREKAMEQMLEYRESLQLRAKKALDLAELNQNLLGLNMASVKLKYEETSDSLQTLYNNKITALENLLVEKEKEHKQELERVPRMGRLVFYNINGTRVSYFGEVRNGKANGQGIGTHATGSVYDGEWRDNKKHGKGTFKWIEGEVYEGEFVNGKREGKGTYKWNNGNKYVGQWQNDKRNGYGILYDKDNKVVFEGNWEKDEFIKPNP